MAALVAETMQGKRREVAGQVVDVVTNRITVRSFGAIHREHRRLDASVTDGVRAHTRALSYMERVRLWHAFLVWGLSAGMLVWAVLLWQVGKITAGDVVVISYCRPGGGAAGLAQSCRGAG